MRFGVVKWCGKCCDYWRDDVVCIGVMSCWGDEYYCGGIMSVGVISTG